MLKDGVSKEHTNQQLNENHIQKSDNTSISAFGLSTIPKRTLSKYFEIYAINSIAKMEGADKGSESMSKTNKGQKECSSNLDLSMIEEYDYQVNISKHHEFKEELGKCSVSHTILYRYFSKSL